MQSKWILKNCKFAQIAFKDLVDQTWEYFGREEQYQLDRLQVRGIPMDTWFRADQALLERAEETEDLSTLQQIRDKYMRLDEEGKAKLRL